MSNLNFYLWIFWNPSKEIFTIPFLERPITWYGVFFVLGFVLGYFLSLPLFSRFLEKSKHLSELDIKNWGAFTPQSSPYLKNLNILADNTYTPSGKDAFLYELNDLLQRNIFSRKELEQFYPGAIQSVKQTSLFLIDRLCWFVTLGTLIGARLGVVVFYDWHYYTQYPLEIFKIWNGGLASHGGALGVALSLYLYVLYIRKWVPTLTFLKVLDAISIPTALTGCFIRMGNFINQEILGTTTQQPWGVIFGDPMGEPVDFLPRHPVQLYEAFAYFLTFLGLYTLWKIKGDRLRTGILSGFLLIGIFSSRFILEFWKANQEAIFQHSYFQMGQLLSLPFIVLGLCMIIFAKKKLFDSPCMKKSTI